ncbi:MAG: prepilin-type N-terminal cleavage/methylation domain-containing protein [Verrucomicrobia bacterium]|nr:prepilin-type N-terminal cleavage/methylation domain-containing protein [Verrucomicrobiota bacterium]
MGFTLIEVIVASSIVTILILGAMSCFRAAIESQKIVDERMENMQKARMVMQMIVDDLRQCVPMVGESEFSGMSRMLGSIEADNLDFATANSRPIQAGESLFHEVSYFVNPGAVEGMYTLFRRRDRHPDAEPLSGGAMEPLVGGLRFLKFEYYDGLDWYDDWGATESIQVEEDSLLAPSNMSGLPWAVRVTISIGKEPSPEEMAAMVSSGGFDASDYERPAILQTIVKLPDQPTENLSSDVETPSLPEGGDP